MVSYFANGNGMAFLGQVLILVVVEDDLVHISQFLTIQRISVLILVVVEDDLVLWQH